MTSKNRIVTAGKVHLVLLSILAIVLGLYLNQWWWQLGVLSLFVIFILAFSKYRADV